MTKRLYVAVSMTVGGLSLLLSVLFGLRVGLGVLGALVFSCGIVMIALILLDETPEPNHQSPKPIREAEEYH